VAESSSASEPQAAVANPLLASVLAWLVPGLGHVYLRRQARGIFFFVLVIAAMLVGWCLDGHLYRPEPNQPLSYVATLGAMGMGLPYFVLRYWFHYQGDITRPGYEYGTAFLLTAGLMNLLLVLDAWDIATGKKE
jgi:hypothetical protein